MSERENNVYKAKLAEQAERYDGEWFFSSFFFGIFVSACTIPNSPQPQKNLPEFYIESSFESNPPPTPR